jgi:hypothetical protein
LEMTDGVLAVYKLYFLVSYASTGSPALYTSHSTSEEVVRSYRRTYRTEATPRNPCLLPFFFLHSPLIDSPCDRLEASRTN